MLTSDLVRVRMQRGEVVPRYIETAKNEYQDLAGSLIAIFSGSVGRTRGELEAELEDFLGTGTQFLLHRGLAKLLFDRCSFDTQAAVDPPALRRAAFEAAALAYRGKSDADEDPKLPFHREVVVGELCRAEGISEEAFEHNLYADLKSQQVLLEFPSLTPAWLLERYNCALAQAVLFRAREIEIEIAGQRPSQYRALLRKIKFFRLLHQVRGDAAKGYALKLDGPLSLFKANHKYGVQMANFLPTLLHFQGWTLSATLLWGRERRERTFRLSPQAGLKPHNRLTGQWQPEEVAWLPQEFEKLQSDWEISGEAELIDLGGQGVLVPDYVFHHPATGTRVYLEIFGFWNRGAVHTRLELLRRHGPPNLILALSKSLNVDPESLAELPAEVYLFRSAPIARQVLAVLQGFVARDQAPS